MQQDILEKYNENKNIKELLNIFQYSIAPVNKDKNILNVHKV